MPESNKRTRRTWREMSQRQMETAIAIGGGVLLVTIIATVFMLDAWGLVGTIWRLSGFALVAIAAYLAWRYRRKIAAHIAKRRQEAANRAAAEAAAIAAAEAGRPKPLRGTFPARMAFLGLGATLATDRGTLRDPLIYAAAHSTSDSPDEPSLLAADLPVTPIKHATHSPLPYWPRYSAVSSDQRAIYLEWLSVGRRIMPPEIGYVFMFFYGLERRVLIDHQDVAAVFDEVLRLRQMKATSASPNHSFESYATAFLSLLLIVCSDEIGPSAVQTLAESIHSWDEDSLSAMLSWFAQRKRSLPGWMAFIVAGQMPGSKRSVVVNRVEDKFRELFLKRYAHRFANGMAVGLSKRHHVYRYKPASAAIRSAELSNGPNPLGIQSQFKPLSEIWNDCIEDLRRLSSVVKRESEQAAGTTERKLTPAMWESLPTEIRATTDHPMLDRVCRLVQESSDEDGRTLINVGKLAEILCWEAKDRYSISDSVWISRTTEECGYCLEPDPRLTGKAYFCSDTVALFLKTNDEETDMVRYRAAACMLRFGMAVASSDGSVNPAELAAILQDIEQLFQLNEYERRRLEALRNLITIKGPDTGGLAQLAKLLKPEHREAIGKLLLLVAAKDGEVTKEEVQAIRKCYKAMGFAQSDIGHALASLRAYQSDDEPVTVRPGTAPTAGEAIPPAEQKPIAPDAVAVDKTDSVFEPASKKKTVLRLNRAAIAQIMADTREVAQLLAEAMNTDEQPGKTPFSVPFVPPPPVPSVELPHAADQMQCAGEHGAADIAVVPPRYAGFYQLLIAKQEWDVKEVDGLARQHGLMLSGALDALNEWAAQKYGGQLFVEDGEKIVVEQAYLN